MASARRRGVPHATSNEPLRGLLSESPTSVRELRRVISAGNRELRRVSCTGYQENVGPMHNTWCMEEEISLFLPKSNVQLACRRCFLIRHGSSLFSPLPSIIILIHQQSLSIAVLLMCLETIVVSVLCVRAPSLKRVNIQLGDGTRRVKQQ